MLMQGEKNETEQSELVCAKGSNTFTSRLIAQLQQKTLISLWLCREFSFVLIDRHL